MTISMTAGAAAYANTARQLGTAAPTGGGFGDLLQNALQGAVDAQKQGEAASLSAVAGKADLNTVVAAVNNADLSLQTVLAVRDKVLSAYSEIMHMTV